MGHSNVSPSSTERFFACPGSVEAQAKIDTILPSPPAALEGTAIHELAAFCLLHDTDPYDKIGETIEVKDNYGDIHEFTVNDDFAFCVKMYRDTILNILEQNQVSQKALQVETHFELPEVDAKAKGTTDCAFIAGDTLYVFDLKGGRGIVVNPTENKQCMYYALRPYLDAKMFIRRVVIGVIQPRAKEGELIKMWETTPARLDDFFMELKRAISLTRVKDPDIRAGKHCTFCKAKATCTPVVEDIFKSVGNVMPKITDCFPVISALTATQIGNALPSLEILKEFIKTLEGYAFTLAKKGQDIPNYSMTRGTKNRKYRDEAAVIAEFSEEYGDEIYAPGKLRTPAQLEKIVGKENLSEFVFVPEGNLKLVPTKEAKDFVKRSVADAFKDVVLD